MSEKEKNAYILGTDQEELFRLGVQHQVWASEAQEGWRLADFKAGQTLLDLGCGPGFCTKELAYIAGTTGKLIGVDKSEFYIDHLNKVAELQYLNIETIVADFDTVELPTASIDGMFCRWALAWYSKPKEVLSKVYDALRPGGRMVIHEYYDWATHQIEPAVPALSKAIAAALKSFKDSESEVDIGRTLPALLEDLGMRVVSIRPMAKMTTPGDMTWSWPKSFYQSYFPRLVDSGYLTKEELEEAMEGLKELEAAKGASLFCPMMVEVIAEK